MSTFPITRIFIDNSDDYSSKNLSGMIFRDIDYRSLQKQPSFFRCDFRGSNFSGCTFFCNQFGRADFVDAFISNTEFCEANFGSCMFKNVTLEKSLFQSNRYHGVAIQYCYYRNCTFRDENFVTNMFRCTFEQCTFINCTFQKSSLEHNSFNKCEFIKVDMSECIAENLSFTNCALRDVFLNASMWATYLYKGTDINGFAFKYHGEVIDVLHDEIEQYMNQLWENGQLAEFFNTRIIVHKSFPIIDLTKDLRTTLKQAKLQQKLVRRKNLSHILEIIQFYCGASEIEFTVYWQLVSILDEYDWSQFPFDESLEYETGMFQIHQVCQQFSMELNHIYTIPKNEICLITFRLNFDNVEQAKKYLTELYEQTNLFLCDGTYNSPLYDVLSVERGSVVLTVASAALLAVLVSYAAKMVFRNLLSLRIQYKLEKQIIQQLECAGKSIATLNKVCSLARENGFLSKPQDEKKMVELLSSELSKGEILEIIINLLKP